jgi:hypothetical protein
MDVFDIHSKVLQLQRLFRPDLPKANKLSGNTNRANSAVKQQVMNLHQPVDFLMVDDISLLLQLIPDVLVPIAAELLLENRFYVLYHGCIIDQLSI